MRVESVAHMADQLSRCGVFKTRQKNLKDQLIYSTDLSNPIEGFTIALQSFSYRKRNKFGTEFVATVPAQDL
jgi:hypothetical protein